jgi:hypothetical protein
MKYRVKPNGLYGGMYTIEQMIKWTANNTIEAENTTFIDIAYNGSFLLPKFNKDSNEWIESVDLNDEQNNSIEKEYVLYLQRQKEGMSRYLKIAAEFRIKKLNGDISDNFHKIVESTLQPVRDEFVKGQFITSLDLLEQIGSPIIGEQIYNDLHNSINEAITEFYI